MQNRLKEIPQDNCFIAVEKRESPNTREIFYVSESDIAAVSERPVLIGAFLAEITSEPGKVLPLHKGRAARLYFDCANSRYSPLTQDECSQVAECLQALTETHPEAEMLRHALQA